MISFYVPCSPGGQMQCPTCGQFTPEDWKTLYSQPGGHPFKPKVEIELLAKEKSPRGRFEVEGWVVFAWMFCANPECGELVVRMHEARVTGPWPEDGDPDTTTETYTVRPRFASRQIAKEVPDPFKSDYLEAAALLEISPRMSAVLSRKIVHDLIETYAGIKAYSLAKAIDEFREDTNRPSSIRDNLHYLREIADFGAHTQRDQTATDATTNEREEDMILDVSRDDAEWCLDLLDRLFDHLIVQPAQDDKLKQGWAEKIRKAGRKELS